MHKYASHTFVSHITRNVKIGLQKFDFFNISLWERNWRLPGLDSESMWLSKILDKVASHIHNFLKGTNKDTESNINDKSE